MNVHMPESLLHDFAPQKSAKYERPLYVIFSQFRRLWLVANKKGPGILQKIFDFFSSTPYARVHGGYFIVSCLRHGVL
jgi:hypothetical protein